MRRDNGAVQIKLHARFSFFAVLGLLVCLDKDGMSLLCAAACVLHELGHIVVMMIEHRPPLSVTLYGGGIHISGGSTSFLSASAGVIVNFIMFLLFGVISWKTQKIRLFGAVNLLIGVFNLLPIGNLDGRLILDRALTRLFEPVTAARLSDISEKVMMILIPPLTALLVIYGYVNISAVFFIIYVFAVEFLEKI